LITGTTSATAASNFGPNNYHQDHR
jgi:hypothetical protein